MNDAEYEIQKVRLQKLAEKWLGPIGLKWWLLHLSYSRESQKSDNGIDYVAGRCHASWEYLEATITFYLPETMHLDDGRLENVFVHECMHIFVNEMRADGLPHEERVCTQLSNAFQWIREEGREEGRRAALLEMQG